MSCLLGFLPAGEDTAGDTCVLDLLDFQSSQGQEVLNKLTNSLLNTFETGFMEKSTRHHGNDQGGTLSSSGESEVVSPKQHRRSVR